MTNTRLKSHPRAQKLIQLTDCHLYANPDADHKGVQPYRTLESVCRHISARHPDFSALLLTGDLSEDESIASYTLLEQLVSQFSTPAYAIPGNHDRREHMLAAFNDGIRLAGRVDLDPWRIHLLDSAVPGKTGGQLAREELDRLQRDLQDHPANPALVALHHHPLPIGSAWMDRLGLHNGDALNSLLLQHAQAKAVLCGHIHQEFRRQAGHVLYLGTPSTCIQFKPHSLLFARDTLPPAYRVLLLHPDGTIDTHIEYVAAF